MNTKTCTTSTALLLGLAVSGSAMADLCDIPTGADTGKFYVMESPSSSCPKKMQINDPVYAIAECSSTNWNGYCEVWPQVYVVEPGDGEKLQYQWQVRVGFVTTVYPESSNPGVSFSCMPLATVYATVTVRNGAATDSDSVGFRCGDQPN